MHTIDRKRAGYVLPVVTVSVISIVSLLFAFAINCYVAKAGSEHIINTIEGLPRCVAVLLLGAGVRDDGSMSAILSDRAITTLEIYKSRKALKILISGDHGRKGYDEVNVVKAFFLKNGVSEEDIFTDHAGFSTYDSIYRAGEIFRVKSLIIVTQRFHLPRALYIAGKSGLKAYGHPADKRDYMMIDYFETREIAARLKAFLDVHLNARSKFLGDIIPITGDGRKSWD
jgi:vancomycin permeability regulator SanA